MTEDERLARHEQLSKSDAPYWYDGRVGQIIELHGQKFRFSLWLGEWVYDNGPPHLRGLEDRRLPELTQQVVDTLWQMQRDRSRKET